MTTARRLQQARRPPTRPARLLPKARFKRYHWLEDQIKARGYAIGAEIGVKGGKTTYHLLEHCPGLRRIYAVDPWTTYEAQPHPTRQIRGWPANEDEARKIELRFLAGGATEYIRAGRLVVMKTTSILAAPDIQDGALDFVFIDGSHTYHAVTEDIGAWRPKIRPGGLLSGHDYPWPTVRDAVHANIQDLPILTACDGVWFCYIPGA